MSRLIRRKLLMSRRSGAGRIACARFYRPIPRRVNSDRLLVPLLRLPLVRLGEDPGNSSPVCTIAARSSGAISLAQAEIVLRHRAAPHLVEHVVNFPDGCFQP